MGNWDMRKQLNSFTVEQAKSYSERKQTIEEWGRWIDGKLDEGWEGYLITLMFKEIRGSEATKIEVMGRELERVCTLPFSPTCFVGQRRHQQREAPNPHRRTGLPGRQAPEVSLKEILTNDGLHFHGALLIHPDRRLKESVQDYFDTNMHVYVNGKHEFVAPAP